MKGERNHTSTQIDQGTVWHQFICFQVFFCSSLMLADHVKLMSSNNNGRNTIFVFDSHAMQELAMF